MVNDGEQQFYRDNDDVIKLKYKGRTWISLSEFKNGFIRDLNLGKSAGMYYVKICSKSLHVRCRHCKSFRLIFSYDLK